MESAGSSGHPVTPEAIIAQISRQLNADLPEEASLERRQIDRIVESSVRELWSGRVKSFVPILALRQARDLLDREGYSSAAIVRQTPASVARAHVATTTRDSLPLGNDVVAVQPDDALPY